MADAFSYQLCQITSAGNEITISSAAKLDENARSALEHHGNTVLGFFAAQNVVKSVIANRNDVLEAIVMLARNYFDQPQNRQAVMEHASFDISRRFANMCSLFRSFLDHYDRHFLKHYGEKSTEYKTWSQSKSVEYDSYLSYAIVYGMRNYIQHYDMPPLSIKVEEKPTDNGISTDVAISVKELMKDPKFEKKFAAKLDIIAAGIPLFHLIDEWGGSFNRIVEASNRVRAQEALGSARFLLDVRSRYHVSPEGRMAIVRFPSLPERSTINKLDLNMSWVEEKKADELLLFLNIS